MRRPRTTPMLIDLTAHPKAQPVKLPRRGPLALRYVGWEGRVVVWSRVSVGLAEAILRQAGYSPSRPT